MPRYENPKDLTLQTAIGHATTSNSDPTDDTTHAASKGVSRPNSSPIALQGIDLSSIEGSFALSNLPPLPASSPPLLTSQSNKEASRSTLAPTLFKQSNKSRDRLPLSTTTTATTAADRPASRREEEEALQPGSSSMSKIYHLRKAPGSTPELSLLGSAESVSKSTIDVTKKQTDLSNPRPAFTSLLSEENTTKRKDKVFRNPLTRSKSTRKDSHSSKKPSGFLTADLPPPKTAPASTGWDGTDMNNKMSQKRGKSSERQGSEDNTVASSGKAFITGSKNALNKAKTGGGNFLSRIGKIGRSGSSHERDTATVPEEYVLKVINLPLVEQTRITRISKSLEACKDKTEYWMPSLPWRCIDYLNLNCESEGLYRIPGSGPQIKQWQKRFDTELDIDLLDEQELYDPNNISSLLKLWLRELPTEIFPTELQHSLAIKLEKENPEFNKMGQPAPKDLKDTLSELSPFNYYLLFAITCHLSLLVSHADKNRMDLHNLAICVGPCLKIERWLFNYLIGDWRNCWQGCWTEKRTLEEERRIEDPTYVSEAVDIPTIQAHHTSNDDDAAVSSGGESMVSAAEHIERPTTSSSNRRLASRDNSNTRSSSNTRRPQN